MRVFVSTGSKVGLITGDISHIAQLLHTVTEDNHPAIQLLCSSQDHLGQLEVVLTSSDLPDPEGRGAGNVGQLLLIRTAIAGGYTCTSACSVLCTFCTC